MIAIVQPPAKWAGPFIDAVGPTAHPGEHKLRVRWTPDVSLIDYRTFPGMAHLVPSNWPPHDAEYQPLIRAAEEWLDALHEWERAMFPRPTPEPLQVAYAAPGDEFGCDQPVANDAWVELTSANGQTIRVCLDVSDVTEDGILLFEVPEDGILLFESKQQGHP